MNVMGDGTYVDEMPDAEKVVVGTVNVGKIVTPMLEVEMPVDTTEVEGPIVDDTPLADGFTTAKRPPFV